MRAITALVCAGVLLLTACASPNFLDIGPLMPSGGFGSNTTVVLEDKRPDSDRNLSFGSFFVGSSDYGVITLGDVSFKPPIMDAIRSRILQAASNMSQAPTRVEIVVDRLIVQDNKQAAWLRQQSLPFLEGTRLGLGIFVGELLRGQTIDLDYDKTRPFVIAVFKGKITVDGSTRELVVTKVNNYAHQNDAAAQRAALNATIDAFLKALSEEATQSPSAYPRPTYAGSNGDNGNMVQRLPVGVGGTGAMPARGKTTEQKLGKYSYQIEKTAKADNCHGGSGAYLTTDAGPIESYRIDCEGGAVYLARCEYGICAVHKPGSELAK